MIFLYYIEHGFSKLKIMRRLLGTISLILSVFCSYAQTAKPIRWTFTLSKNEVKQGGTVDIIMKAEINADWYLYSSDFDPNLGPTVTTFSFVPNNSFEAVGPLKAIDPKEKYDSLWEGKIRYYTKHAEFRQKVKLLTENPILKGTLAYQVCSDKEGKCIPYEETLSFDKLKVIVPENVPTTTNTQTDPVIEPKQVKETKNTPLPKDKLLRLEAEKNKLIEKDSAGNDVTIGQLKTFVQKYGGDK